MICGRDFYLVPDRMAIYNPPVSDSPFAYTTGNVDDFAAMANDICNGAGALADNKRKYIALARDRANRLANAIGWDYYINGLESQRTKGDCTWGAKRARVADVIRVLKAERQKWVAANTGTVVTTGFNPITADWKWIALDIGDGKISKEKITADIRNAISRAANNYEAVSMYNAAIDGLERNRTNVAWGIKRTRLNGAVRHIKANVQISNANAGISNNLPESGAVDVPVEKPTVVEQITDFLGLPRDSAIGAGQGRKNGSESGDDPKPNYTPLIAGGSAIAGIILLGIAVTAFSKSKKAEK